MSDILTHKGAIITAVAVALCTAISISVSMYGLSVTVASSNNFTVVLDAGHGGIDGGVSGLKTGTPESEINLSIVKKARAYFEEAGLNCVLTRSTEAGLYGTLSKGFKKRDMQKRKEIIEEAKPVAVVSVHQNFYSSSSSRGGQVFYCKENENSRLLATAIQKGINSLDDGVERDRSVLAGDYFILNCTQYPSVIVECGFLSNAEDEALLISDSYQDVLALTIFNGVIEYISVPSVK